MALFSNKIESVKFVDRNEKTIEVLYKQKADSKTLSHYIVELNYDNQDFLDLIEEYSIEDIQDNTQKYYENLTQAKNDNILNHAKRMFDEWVINAQKDLDKQDEERYKIFEKYREQQLETFQSEADAQVERRVQEGYEGVQAVIDKEYEGVQAEVDRQVEKQVKKKYLEVEAYKEEQLKILQAEVDEQVERRIAEGFADVDAYREKQLTILQKELDQQVEQRYKEADEYKDSQINIIQQEVKTDLLSKFNVPRQTTISYTPEKVAKYMIDNFKDEDTVFKTKLEIFNLPEVKNSKDREMKMKVRKAKTVPEIFAAYHDIQCNHS